QGTGRAGEEVGAQASSHRSPVAYLPTASLTPKPKNKVPTARRATVPADSLALICDAILAAASARITHQIVPVVIKVAPRNNNANSFELAAGFTNCGKKAR